MKLFMLLAISLSFIQIPNVEARRKSEKKISTSKSKKTKSKDWNCNKNCGTHLDHGI